MAIKMALVAALAGWCVVLPVHASSGCDVTLTAQYTQDVRIVAQLRANEPGQMRVFAADGSEFTAGQARWLQGQLTDIEQACARGDRATAQRRLNAVEQLLNAHKRES
jgi:hypothetical protein